MAKAGFLINVLGTTSTYLFRLDYFVNVGLFGIMYSGKCFRCSTDIPLFPHGSLTFVQGFNPPTIRLPVGASLKRGVCYRYSVMSVTDERRRSSTCATARFAGLHDLRCCVRPYTCERKGRKESDLT